MEKYVEIVSVYSVVQIYLMISLISRPMFDHGEL